MPIFAAGVLVLQCDSARISEPSKRTYGASPNEIGNNVCLVACHKPTYTIVDLGTLGGTSSVAYGINKNGDVVGGADTAAGVKHAFVYKNGQMQDLNLAPDNQFAISEAAAINNSGKIVGKLDYSGFLYSNGTVTDLGFNTYGWDAYATGINKSGVVVGGAYEKDEVFNALTYNNGTVSFVKTPGDQSVAVSFGRAINDNGYVTGGNYADLYSDLRAFLTQGDITIEIGTLGGNSSYGQDVNNLNQVVGAADLANGDSHAFFYMNNTMLDLGTLGGKRSAARAINKNGVVVGWAQTSDGNQYAARWTNGQITNLSTLPAVVAAGWTQLSTAYDINASGKIVGVGTINGNQHAFLLTPYSCAK